MFIYEPQFVADSGGPYFAHTIAFISFFLLNGYFVTCPPNDLSSVAAGDCNALSGFVIIFHSYYYFSSGVSFPKILESLRNLT